MRTQKVSRIGSLVYGFTLPFQCISLIFAKPKLLLWSVLPVILTAVSYGFIYVKTQDFIRDFTTQILSHWGLNPEGWIAATFILLSKILLFILGALTFSLFSNIIACPLNDFLAEETERYTSPALDAVHNRRISFRIKVIGIDLIKTTFAAFVQCLSLFISWLPLVNVVAILLTILLLTFQFVSYPQTRRGEGVYDGIRFIFSHLYSCLGFGAAVVLVFSIPFLSCLFLPLAVTGGTLLYGRSRGSATLPALR
jgi:uncharacterized protein involved in cysteine biosynthesis